MALLWHVPLASRKEKQLTTASWITILSKNICLSAADEDSGCVPLVPVLLKHRAPDEAGGIQLNAVLQRSRPAWLASTHWHADAAINTDEGPNVGAVVPFGRFPSSSWKCGASGPVGKGGEGG